MKIYPNLVQIYTSLAPDAWAPPAFVTGQRLCSQAYAFALGLASQKYWRPDVKKPLLKSAYRL